MFFPPFFLFLLVVVVVFLFWYNSCWSKHTAVAIITNIIYRSYLNCYLSSLEMSLINKWNWFIYKLWVTQLNIGKCFSICWKIPVCFEVRLKMSFRSNWSILMKYKYLFSPQHHIEKRRCNTATCMTQRLADFLIRSSNTVGTVYIPTDIGANTYGKRDVFQSPNLLPL